MRLVRADQVIEPQTTAGLGLLSILCGSRRKLRRNHRKCDFNASSHAKFPKVWTTP